MLVLYLLDAAKEEWLGKAIIIWLAVSGGFMVLLLLDRFPAKRKTGKWMSRYHMVLGTILTLAILVSMVWLLANE